MVLTATKWWWVGSYLCFAAPGGLWSLNEAVAGKPGGGPKTLPKVIAYIPLQQKQWCKGRVRDGRERRKLCDNR